jgi:ribonucleoside-diphosphate reductase alpha chain
MSVFASTVMMQKYAQEGETWTDIANRVTKSVFKAVNAPKSLIEQTTQYIIDRKFLPGGRYLYAAGRAFHQVNNCLLMKAEDSREGWSELMQRCTMGLMTGAGIGVDYSAVRGEGKPIRKTGGFATGPLALMQMVNEAGRGVMQGGSRRSALWAGLSWKHADIVKFTLMKNWIPEVRAMKAKDFNFPATMDGTNVSVQLDDTFFDALNCSCSGFQASEETTRCALCDFPVAAHWQHSQAEQVYWATLERMLKTGEPGFSIDCGKNRNETLRNACTELTSHDDSDVCNLGSVNLARVTSLAEMDAIVECATAFLLAGTAYSDVPYAKVDMVRTKNRRLGLGLMGLHEWLLVNGKRYGPDVDLDKYLTVYTKSKEHSMTYADKWDLSYPVKTRAVAPVGTIGILGETSTGIEPIFCAAYKRRYLKGNVWHYQYVLDPTAKRLIEEQGVNPDAIEDAYVLADDIERRLEFQAHVQGYVDHAISSTLNLPQWGSELNNKGTVQKFGKALLKYLPSLRGVTAYPDGARDGQPLTPVKWATAIKHVGEIFVETTDVCELRGAGGSCGA